MDNRKQTTTNIQFSRNITYRRNYWTVFCAAPTDFQEVLKIPFSLKDIHWTDDTIGMDQIFDFKVEQGTCIVNTQDLQVRRKLFEFSLPLKYLCKGKATKVRNSL
jgi:hypothetical protein